MKLKTPSSSSETNNDGYALVDHAHSSPPPPAPADTPSAEVPALTLPAAAPDAKADATPAADVEKRQASESAGKDKDKDKDGPRAVSLRRKKRKASRRHLVPAWVVSFVVHVVILAGLALATFHPDAQRLMASINTALVDTKGSSEEMTPIYADPSMSRSEEAVGNEHADTPGGGGGSTGTGIGGIGAGAPSATPAVTGVGSGVGEKNSLAGGINLGGPISNLGLMPAAPGMDLGGGGMILGQPMFEAHDVGASLDQIAREILRHLQKHKLTVVWLFDESESMKDDQKAIREKFDRVATELKLNVEQDKKAAGALNHAIVGFGQDIHYVLEKPTLDIDAIGRAIERLRVDDSGTENTLHALTDVIDHYSGYIKKDRRLLIVLVTDESGDDGGYIEEALQAATGGRKEPVPIYVIGRQSLFGYERAHLRYVDPVTKDVYWPAIRRGPETADVELLQWDGLHERWDEQPSGFAPYELARLAKDTGGIYFLLPSEENMRVRQREKAYKFAELKEYVPDYASRAAYVSVRQKSEFRRTLFAIIQATRSFPYRRHFPVDPALMIPAANEAGQESTVKLATLLEIQKQLEGLKKLRDREPDKRWQAHYDLMLAQIVTYQIKSYEYRACLEEMVNKPPVPRKMPSAELVVEWVIDHSLDRKAPKERTEKKYADATALLKDVIAKHPKTPWADLAQDELNRGLGAQRNEWHHNPKYDERAKLVPKY